MDPLSTNAGPPLELLSGNSFLGLPLSKLFPPKLLFALVDGLPLPKPLLELLVEVLSLPSVKLELGRFGSCFDFVRLLLPRSGRSLPVADFELKPDPALLSVNEEFEGALDPGVNPPCGLNVFDGGAEPVDRLPVLELSEPNEPPPFGLNPGEEFMLKVEEGRSLESVLN